MQCLPYPLIRVLLFVGIEHVPLKNSGILMAVTVSMIPGDTVPNRFLGGRILAAASVIRCSLYALLVPPTRVSPDWEARTPERVSYGFRRSSPKRHEHSGERCMCIWLLSVRRRTASSPISSTCVSTTCILGMGTMPLQLSAIISANWAYGYWRLSAVGLLTYVPIVCSHSVRDVAGC